MTEWIVKHEEPDLEVLEESALFLAQATIQNAINEAGLSRAELAKKMDCPRSFISRMLSGRHNLTVRLWRVQFWPAVLRSGFRELRSSGSGRQTNVLVCRILREYPLPRVLFQLRHKVSAIERVRTVQVSIVFPRGSLEL